MVAGSPDASGSHDSHDASKASIERRRVKINQELELMPKNASGRWRKVASYLSVESVDMLLRVGHNFYSWCVEVVKAVDLQYHENRFKVLIVCNPVSAINGNTKSDEVSTSSHCVIL